MRRLPGKLALGSLSSIGGWSGSRIMRSEAKASLPAGWLPRPIVRNSFSYGKPHGPGRWSRWPAIVVYRTHREAFELRLQLQTSTRGGAAAASPPRHLLPGTRGHAAPSMPLRRRAASRIWHTVTGHFTQQRPRRKRRRRDSPRNVGSRERCRWAAMLRVPRCASRRHTYYGCAEIE